MRWIGLLIVLVALFGCHRREESIDSSINAHRYAQGVVEAIIFVRHASGLCFAVTYVHTYSSGPAIAAVPTEYCLWEGEE